MKLPNKYLRVVKDRRCPKCEGGDISRSHRKSFWERAVSMFGVYPYRCNVCGHRFMKPTQKAGIASD